MIEFPYKETDLPRDKQKKPIECKVQVKSTQGKDKRVGIKLSVLKWLIDYPLPAFILFYEFSDDKEPRVENTYLVHIDKSIMTRVLKKIRKNDISDQPQELHKIRLQICYDNTHKLASNSGNALKEKIASFVPAGMSEYQKSKNDIIENVGYEKGGGIIRFQAQRKDFSSYLTQSALGIAESFEVEDIAQIDDRFELKGGRIEVKRIESAQITISPSFEGECIVSFKTSQFSPPFNFRGDVLSIPNTETGKKSFFFKTALFSLEIDYVDKRSISSKTHWTRENRVELDEVIRFFKLFSPKNRGKKLILNIKTLKEEKILSLLCDLELDFPDNTQLADSIKVLQDSYELDGKTLTSIDELYAQELRFNALSGIIQNKIENVRQVTLPKKSGNEKFLNEKEIKIPFSIGVSIGSVFIGAITVHNGVQVADYEYKIHKIEVLKRVIFDDGTSSLKEFKALEVEEVQKAYPTDRIYISRTFN